MNVKLRRNEEREPLRRISGFMGHPVGGVGTPWWVKMGRRGYIEVACFAHGCNLRCPQCQNFTVTYGNAEDAMTPREAAEMITAYRRNYGVDRMAISGGEPTLNRRWLIKYFEVLRQLNKDPKARLHLDTNATILTPNFVDELVEVGVTDVGPDVKGLHIETFIKITGVTDRELASKYLQNEWGIVKYLIDNYYPDKIFTGVGIPYNRRFMTLDELREMGDRIASIDPELQVCLLDYYPTFRRRDMDRPTFEEMKRARAVLKESGLKTVLAQTPLGHIGP
jgi:pyruvate formate lyase activating enzyme